MFATSRVVRFVIGASLVLAMASAAQAQTGYLRTYPSYVQRPYFVQPAVPTLGFYGHPVINLGMVIDSVVPGSLAQQLGLEARDVIVEVNGYAIRSQGDYYAAMQAGGGTGQMTVLDWRTNRYLSVSLAQGASQLYNVYPSSQTLFYAPAPVYRRAGPSHHPHHHHHHHHVNTPLVAK